MSRSLVGEIRLMSIRLRAAALVGIVILGVSQSAMAGGLFDNIDVVAQCITGLRNEGLIDQLAFKSQAQSETMIVVYSDPYFWVIKKGKVSYFKQLSVGSARSGSEESTVSNELDIGRPIFQHDAIYVVRRKLENGNWGIWETNLNSGVGAEKYGKLFSNQGSEPANLEDQPLPSKSAGSIADGYKKPKETDDKPSKALASLQMLREKACQNASSSTSAALKYCSDHSKQIPFSSDSSHFCPVQTSIPSDGNLNTSVPKTDSG